MPGLVEPLAGPGRWPDRAAQHFPHRYRNHLRAYGRWVLIRRPQRRATRRRFTSYSAVRARHPISAAAAFLTWIDTQGLSLATSPKEMSTSG